MNRLVTIELHAMYCRKCGNRIAWTEYAYSELHNHNYVICPDCADRTAVTEPSITATSGGGE